MMKIDDMVEAISSGNVLVYVGHDQSRGYYIFMERNGDIISISNDEFDPADYRVISDPIEQMDVILSA